MDPTSILMAAKKAVDEAGIDEALWPVAFGKAVDILSRDVASPESAGPPAPISGSPLPLVQDGSMLSQIAQKLNLDVSVVEQVFYAEGDELQIIVGPRKVNPRAAAATKELALLLAAGRQAARVEEWTSATTIRDVCQEYKRFDSPNFANTIKEMGEVFNFRGTGQKREVRMTRPGWDRAADLVRRLGNGVED